MKFRHRLGESNGTFGFDCYRSAEHPVDKPRFREFFDSKIDRDRYVTRHDTLYHDELFRAQLGIDAAVPILGDIVAAFMSRSERDWRAGRCDSKTVDYYRKIARRIVYHLGADTRANQITTRVIMTKYWDVRLDASHREKCPMCQDSTTQGEMVKKEIKALGTMFRDYGVAPPWLLRRGALKGVKKPKVLHGVEKIVRFILAMPPLSLERDFCVFKFATGIRNEEIYAANVGDENLKRRELEYRLRNKQGELERHVTYLNDSALDVLLRRSAGRPRGAPLFELDGRRMSTSTCRKRFIAASKRATATWREADPDAPEIMITAIGQFRHEVASAVKDRLEAAGVTNATGIVASQFGHRHDRTAETHYLIGSKAGKVEKSKAFTSESEDVLAAVRRSS